MKSHGVSTDSCLDKVKAAAKRSDEGRAEAECAGASVSCLKELAAIAGTMLAQFRKAAAGPSANKTPITQHGGVAG
jgi:hypothetical protein